MTARETTWVLLEDWPLPSLRDIGREGRLSTFINRQQQQLEFPVPRSSAAPHQGRWHRPSITVRRTPCRVTLHWRLSCWAISLWPSASLVTAVRTTSQTLSPPLHYLPSPSHFPSPFSLEWNLCIQQSIKQSCWSPSLSITHCLSRLDGSSLGRYVFGSEISYNKAPPRLPGLGC